MILAGCASNCQVKPIIPDDVEIKALSLDQKQQLDISTKEWIRDCIN